MADVLGLSYFVWLLAGIILAFYLYMTRKFGFWKSLGIPEVPPLIFTGSVRLDFQINQGKQEQQWYQKYGRIFGIYEGSNPVLMVAEPELLKDILLKDFYVFSDQRHFSYVDPILDKRLYSLNGKRWKDLRNIMRPAFMSSKLKSISKLVDVCAENLVENLIDEAKRSEEVDVNKCINAFTIDALATCAFGIKINSVKDPNNDFVKAVYQLLDPDSWRNVVGSLLPDLAAFLQLSLFEPSVIEYFKNVVTEEIKKREKLNNEEKPCDFLQMLMDAKESLEEKNNGHKLISELELDDIVAQCISFFIAGYQATSSTLAFAIHQLAVKTIIQEKIIKEQEQVIKMHGEIDYETINEMQYLEAAVHETLRYYCPVIRLERTATEDYQLGNTGVVVPKGTLVVVPIYGISHDPKYFSRPEKYNPDRFYAENRKNILPFTYMPFGAGPRNCIGMKFAFIEIKLILAKILYYVKFKPGTNTLPELEFSPGRGCNRPKDVVLKVEIQRERCKEKK